MSEKDRKSSGVYVGYPAEWERYFDRLVVSRDGRCLFFGNHGDLSHQSGRAKPDPERGGGPPVEGGGEGRLMLDSLSVTGSETLGPGSGYGGNEPVGEGAGKGE